MALEATNDSVDLLVQTQLKLAGIIDRLLDFSAANVEALARAKVEIADVLTQNASLSADNAGFVNQDNANAQRINESIAAWEQLAVKALAALPSETPVETPVDAPVETPVETPVE